MLTKLQIFNTPHVIEQQIKTNYIKGFTNKIAMRLMVSQRTVAKKRRNK